MLSFPLILASRLAGVSNCTAYLWLNRDGWIITIQHIPVNWVCAGVGDLLGNTQLYHSLKSLQDAPAHTFLKGGKRRISTFLLLALLLIDHIIVRERVVSLPRVSYPTVVSDPVILQRKANCVQLTLRLSWYRFPLNGLELLH